MLLLTTAIIVDQYIVTGYHAVSVMLLLTTAIVELLISILLPVSCSVCNAFIDYCYNC